MEKIKTAIVGFGRWGQLLFNAGKHCEKLDVTAVVTRTPSKVQSFCSDAGLSLTDDLDKVLADESIEALVIATPHTQHYEQLLKAASAAKHVYCEKPFTLQGDQASQAIEALADNGCKVAIGHNRRFAPNTLAMKKMIEQGWFGDLVHIDGVFHAHMAQSKGRWRDSVAESPAGGMTSLGIHVVDMFINLMGPVKGLRASSDRIAPSCAFDDNTMASMTFDSGARGQLTTITSTAMRWQIALYGTNGWAELRGLDQLVIQPLEGAYEEIHYPGFAYPGEASITAALDAFATDIQGGEPFAVSPQEIVHGTRVLQTIIRSAANGQYLLV